MEKHLLHSFITHAILNLGYIEEVDTVAFLELEQIDEQVALIESFKQPFPLRERGSTGVDGEMDSYG